MRPTSITIAIPVGDLARARAGYDAVLDRHAELEPVPGIVEYAFAGAWIQLLGGRHGSAGWTLRYGVEDLAAEHRRLRALGVEPGAVETVPGVIGFFAFRDPDGDELSCYRVLGATGGEP